MFATAINNLLFTFIQRVTKEDHAKGESGSNKSAYKTEDDALHISYFVAKRSSSCKITIYNKGDTSDHGSIGSSTVANGTVPCSEFSNLFLEQEAWGKEYYRLLFVTNQQVLSFVRKEHKLIWKCYAENNFPTFDIGFKRLNKNKQEAILKYERAKESMQKYNPRINFILADGGWCDIYSYQKIKGNNPYHGYALVFSMQY
eukprot:4951613-Ditylum_brightwellii.AAC.1